MGGDPALSSEPVRRRTWAAIAALPLIWFSLMRRFQDGDVYSVMGPFAACVVALVIALEFRRVAEWCAPRARSIGVGLIVGVTTTALTYPIFNLCVTVWPPLVEQVRALYTGAEAAPPTTRLMWTCVIIVAEELLFRGLLLYGLRGRQGLPTAAAIAVLAYALAQLGAGSWIVSFMALVMGTVWTLQRIWTRSLLSPLLSHLIWTPIVIVWIPVV